MRNRPGGVSATIAGGAIDPRQLLLPARVTFFSNTPDTGNDNYIARPENPRERIVRSPALLPEPTIDPEIASVAAG